ncbi:questin oxidase family protein [Micromonospora sp. WMMD812]|uniref:questin oxidase family protein n=1 Tax=Micromonospora sp. WMMD812 TaxID=3015152 RepID=UPI00248B6A27|nr:questin oxidase family protein [Micromonospora sp. WMMD812]WBB65665.1 questin oxidase family protein [Micromonospora sp. WMMD812]
MSDGILDEAYQRLHRTGPEYDGWLSNHGPMAVEALVRHGHDRGVHRWLDEYLARLDELPRGLRPIDDWRAALGDPKRAGDWLAHFDRELRERPWRDVLGTWWPRLLPGIAAGATHGVIRVGHAVRALRADETSPQRRAELGQALGYWAARWQPVPGAARLIAAAALRSDDEPAHRAAVGGVPEPGSGDGPGSGHGPDVDAALGGLPRIADRSGGIRERLSRLPDVPEWTVALTALRPARTPAEAERGLTALTHRAGLDYLRFAHAAPVMLVHAVTAPTAVRRTLPALDPALWAPSLAAAWSATAALTAVYAPPDPATPPAVTAGTPAEVFARAARHGDAHVVKLADAVLDVHAATGDERVLDAAGYSVRLI